MLGDDVRAILPDLRRQAESEMSITVQAYKPNGFTIVNGFEVQAYDAMGASFARVQSRHRKDSTAETVKVGGVDRKVLFGGLLLPITAYTSGGALQIKAGDQGIGWEFVCTSVGSLDDPTLLNRRWLVVSVPADSYRTARRLDIAEVIV